MSGSSPPASDPLAGPAPDTEPSPTGPAEPSPRWLGAVLGAGCVLFVPYIAVLASNLPDHARAAHYDAAWVGLDVFELVALVTTAWLIWTRSAWVALPATAAATLLLCDAWFDVVTAYGARHVTVAVISAVLVELPLAALCVWIARHAEVVRERATRTPPRREA